MATLVMLCNWHQHHMTPMAFSMANDTDASTNTRTGIKSHIIPLKYHLNKRNPMLSLIAPSGSYNRKHVITMYIQKTNMPLQCHI